MTCAIWGLFIKEVRDFLGIFDPLPTHFHIASPPIRRRKALDRVLLGPT